MAISKITLNGTTQIDLTQKTVAPDKMLNGTTALKNDGTDIVGDIPSKTSSDLTVSGATVTAPAGYYGNAASKSVASGSATTPATTITANPSISVSSEGLITSTASASKSVTPSVSAGYVSSGTAGTVTVSGSATSQLSTQAGKTVTPTESEQTAVASGKYTTGAVKVGAVSSTYVGTDIPRNDTNDLTVSGATVTAPSGYYEENASASVASGTEGTPVATKEAVSNYSVSITPSVTNTEGYISGGTKTGTAVTVKAQDLVSGQKNINSSGSTDVTNYASVSVLQMSLPTSTNSFDNGGTKKATIGRSTSNQYLNINKGFLDDKSYYEITAVPDGSVTAPSSISATGASVSVGTNTLTFSKTVSNTPNVTTEGYISSGTAGNSSVSLTASVNTRSSSDLSASGATVTAPAGYYASSASQSVASGTAGIPTATKGGVSNHSVNVTPSVTNTTGYISGGTKTGTPVSVSASELVSGTYSVNASGTADVTNYASISVPAGSASTPQTTIEPSMNISIDADGLITALTQKVVSVTPTVSSGFVSSGTAGNIIVDGRKTKQLTTQAKTVAMPDNTGDILAGLTTQYAYTFRAEELVQGQWNLNVPADTPLTRARTKDFIYVAAGDTITYTNNSYDCYFQVYGSKSSSTIAQTIGWKTDSGGTINITTAGYLTFVTRNHYDTSANVNPALWDGAVTLTHTTPHNGVNFTWNGTDTCVVSGTCNDVGAVCQMTGKQSIPSSIIPGNTYYVTCTSTPLQSNARLRIMLYDANDTITYFYFNQNGFFVVPSDAVSWNVQLHSMPSVSYSPTVTLSNIHIYPAKKIVDSGTYTTGDIYVSGYGNYPEPNVAKGTFIGTSTSAAIDVPILYSGKGYQISVQIYPKEGSYNTSQGTMASLIQNGAIVTYFASKNETNTTPDYSASSSINNATIMVLRKSSTTSATTYTAVRGEATKIYTNEDAISTGYSYVRFKNNNTMSVYIASAGSVGFAANVEYEYVIVYST